MRNLREERKNVLKERTTSVFSNGLLWFGAAASIAEILTGTLLAPLGFGRGLAAILLGHAVGCAGRDQAGRMGGKTGRGPGACNLAPRYSPASPAAGVGSGSSLRQQGSKARKNCFLN
jgi:hypothetical protein